MTLNGEITQMKGNYPKTHPSLQPSISLRAVFIFLLSIQCSCSSIISGYSFHSPFDSTCVPSPSPLPPRNVRSPSSSQAFIPPFFNLRFYLSFFFTSRPLLPAQTQPFLVLFYSPPFPHSCCVHFSAPLFSREPLPELVTKAL